MSARVVTKDEYLARVKAALADLPGDEVAEILEDVEPHLAEVFAENGEGRLGTPERYAAELRAAAGYPEPAAAPVERPRKAGGRLVLWGAALMTVVAGVTGSVVVNSTSASRFVPLVLAGIVMAAVAALVIRRRVGRADVEALGEYRAARRFGRSVAAAVRPDILAYVRGLQPAWWLLRIVLLALGFVAAIYNRAGGESLFFLLIIGVLLWCGPRVRVDRRFLLVIVPANAFVIGLAAGLIGNTLSRFDNHYYPVSYGVQGISFDGQPLSNVYAADAEGKPIPEFYLYDEKGRPLNVYQPSCDRRAAGEERNRFPLPSVDYRSGTCVADREMPFVPLPPARPVPPQSSTSGPSTTPSQVPSTSVPPSSSGAPASTTTAPAPTS